MLLLFLEASCRGHKPAFKTLLFGGILWHDEFVVIEACLVFGGRHIVIILNLSVCRSLMRAGFSIFLRRILIGWVFFGTIRGSIISRAGITIFALAVFRAAPLTPTLWLFLGGVIPRCSIAISIFWSIHHIYVI